MKYSRDCSERMQAKTLRILRTIDVMAMYRFPKTLRAINRRVCEASGVQYCERTTLRDLKLLQSIGLIVESAEGFKLDLKRSERLQCAACALFPSEVCA